MKYVVLPEKIGEKLRKLRGKRTQQEVAEEVGISQSALHMYETGSRVPRDNVKIDLANFYKTSIEELFYTE